MGKKKQQQQHNNNNNNTRHYTTHSNRVFLLDIRNDHRQVTHGVVVGGCGGGVSETVIHRKIIDLFKHRDDFSEIDLNIRTSRGLSSTTRVDLSNALMHMRSKGKKLRRLSADIDYMEPSVHEFVLLNCLWFEEIRLTSNPEEKTYLSVGLTMSLRHALTMNQKCTRVLDLTCGLSEETNEMLAEALSSAHQLEYFRLHLLSGRSALARSILEGLRGKSKLHELHLSHVNADVAESLALLLNDSNCRIAELDLSYPWEESPQYNTSVLCLALEGVQNKSVKRLLFDGIFFSTITKHGNAHVSVSSASSRVLPLAFPNMEALSMAAPIMPSLDFLELPQSLLPRKLTSCYFPCTQLDIEQGRNLVERIPTIVDIPDFASDSVVMHMLDWRKIIGQQQAPTCAALWPFILERTNIVLREFPCRKANMLYTLLQDYHGFQKHGLLDDGKSQQKEKRIVITRRIVAKKEKSKQETNKVVEKKIKEIDEEAAIATNFDLFNTLNAADGDY